MSQVAAEDGLDRDYWYVIPSIIEPLCYAAQYDRILFHDLLHKSTLGVDEIYNICDTKHNTLLHYAIRGGNIENVSLLLSYPHSSNENSPPTEGIEKDDEKQHQCDNYNNINDTIEPSTLKPLEHVNKLMRQHNGQGQTPLHIATASYDRIYQSYVYFNDNNIDYYNKYKDIYTFEYIIMQINHIRQTTTTIQNQQLSTTITQTPETTSQNNIISHISSKNAIKSPQSQHRKHYTPWKRPEHVEFPSITFTNHETTLYSCVNPLLDPMAPPNQEQIVDIFTRYDNIKELLLLTDYDGCIPFIYAIYHNINLGKRLVLSNDDDVLKAAIVSTTCNNKYSGLLYMMVSPYLPKQLLCKYNTNISLYESSSSSSSSSLLSPPSPSSLHLNSSILSRIIDKSSLPLLNDKLVQLELYQSIIKSCYSDSNNLPHSHLITSTDDLLTTNDNDNNNNDNNNSEILLINNITLYNNLVDDINMILVDNMYSSLFLDSGDEWGGGFYLSDFPIHVAVLYNNYIAYKYFIDVIEFPYDMTDHNDHDPLDMCIINKLPLLSYILSTCPNLSELICNDTVYKNHYGQISLKKTVFEIILDTNIIKATKSTFPPLHDIDLLDIDRVKKNPKRERRYKGDDDDHDNPEDQTKLKINLYNTNIHHDCNIKNNNNNNITTDYAYINNLNIEYHDDDSDYNPRVIPEKTKYYNFKQYIQLLVEYNGDINTYRGNISLLHYAARYSYKSVILLLDNNADCRSIDHQHHMIPLHYAAMYIKLSSMNMLIKSCPRSIKIKDKYGKNVLYHLLYGILYQEYARIQGGVKYTPEIDVEKMIAFLLRKKSVDINCCDINTGQLPIHLAARLRYEPLITKMIECNADITCTDAKGNLPLHYYPQSVGLLNAYDKLDINLKSGVHCRNKDGLLPLHCAASESEVLWYDKSEIRYEILLRLAFCSSLGATTDTTNISIPEGSYINVRDSKGLSALRHAQLSKNRNIELVLTKMSIDNTLSALNPTIKKNGGGASAACSIQ